MMFPSIQKSRNPLIYKGLREVRPTGFEPATFRVGVAKFTSIFKGLRHLCEHYVRMGLTMK